MAEKKNTEEATPGSHWADNAAEELIRRHPDKETLVCASGISPSGMVHIGNFREVVTVEFVVRALKARGKKVRFLSFRQKMRFLTGSWLRRQKLI